MNVPAPSRCLVVDDDPQILRLVERLLRELHPGEIAACDHPVRAIDAFLEAPDAFRLLVTDLDMPGLNGIELAQHLRLLAPQLPVLLVTGSSLGDDALASPEIRRVLRKPFTRQEFQEAVGQVLEEASAFAR